MTQHEALMIVAACTASEVPPLWSDVIDVCSNNLTDERPGSFETVFRRLVRKGLLNAGRCSADCHARHLWLSTEGASWLALWNEKGCGEECSAGCYRSIVVVEE